MEKKIKWIKGKENPARDKNSISYRMFEVARRGATRAEFYQYANKHGLAARAYLRRLIERGCIAASELVQSKEDRATRKTAE